MTPEAEEQILTGDPGMLAARIGDDAIKELERRVLVATEAVEPPRKTAQALRWPTLPGLRFKPAT